MSENLKSFLKALAEDPEKKARFKENPHAVMDEHGVEEKHKQMILAGEKDKLKEDAGLDDAETNMIIA